MAASMCSMPKSGKFMTQLKDTNNKVISLSGLWALAFGQGGGMNGKPNQLFFTAGPNGYANGLFGVINFQVKIAVSFATFGLWLRNAESNDRFSVG